MDNNLNILITYFEEEKERLLKLMKDFLEEDEYEFAHFHSLALEQVNKRLHVLKNMDDELYDAKDFKQCIIHMVEEQLKSATEDGLIQYISRELLKEKEELQRLNEMPKQEYDYIKPVLLDEIFGQLLDKKIKSFRLD